MCGYCVESAFFQTGAPLRSDDPVEAGLMQHIRLQEVSNWFDCYQSRQNHMTKLDDMIVLCRAWDNYFFKADQEGPFFLRRRMPEDRWDVLLLWLRPNAPSPEWEWALHPDVIRIPDNKAVTRVLSDYRRTHLQMIPSQKFRERECNKRQSLKPEQFFWIFIALVLSDRFDPLMLEAGYIATEIGSRVPDFHALDLWLQRRAVMAHVRRNGVGFLNAHKESMREEIVSSVAMATRADANYLNDLEQAIRKKEGWDSPQRMY